MLKTQKCKTTKMLENIKMEFGLCYGTCSVLYCIQHLFFVLFFPRKKISSSIFNNWAMYGIVDLLYLFFVFFLFGKLQALFFCGKRFKFFLETYFLLCCFSDSFFAKFKHISCIEIFKIQFKQTILIIIVIFFHDNSDCHLLHSFKVLNIF